MVQLDWTDDGGTLTAREPGQHRRERTILVNGRPAGATRPHEGATPPRDPARMVPKTWTPLFAEELRHSGEVCTGADGTTASGA